MFRASWTIFLCLFTMKVSAGVTVGETVPDVNLPLLSGNATIELSDYRGKVVYIDFWASWCAPCRLSLPEIDRLRKTYSRKFEVLAINLDEDPEDAMNFLEDHPVSYPVVSDRFAKYPSLFGLKGMPTSYIIDQDGRLRYIHEGYRKGDSRTIELVVRELISERE